MLQKIFQARAGTEIYCRIAAIVDHIIDPHKFSLCHAISCIYIPGSKFLKRFKTVTAETKYGTQLQAVKMIYHICTYLLLLIVDEPEHIRVLSVYKILPQICFLKNNIHSLL